MKENKVIKLSPAKLNLYLEVLEKTSDGFHNLESLMTFCQFGDVITLKKAKSFDFSIDGPFSQNLSTKNNIVLNSIYFLEEFFDRKFDVHVNLTKNLPISSGMGGGSSNAATTILCLLDLYKITLKKNFYKKLFHLGADVPFCFLRKSAIVEGKGEKVSPIKIQIPSYFVLLVNPMIEISTKKVFESLKIKKGKRKKTNFNIINKNEIINFSKMKKNDLELHAIKQCPKIKLTLEFLKNKTNSLLTRMTGSGATCFALYEDQENLNNAEIIIKKKFKDFWTTKTRITNSI